MVGRFIQEANNPNPMNDTGEELDDPAVPFDLESIQSVLSSLSNLLTRSESRSTNTNEPRDNDERAE